jgi:hypothetical protein
MLCTLSAVFSEYFPTKLTGTHCTRQDQGVIYGVGRKQLKPLIDCTQRNSDQPIRLVETGQCTAVGQSDWLNVSTSGTARQRPANQNRPGPCCHRVQEYMCKVYYIYLSEHPQPVDTFIGDIYAKNRKYVS